MALRVVIADDEPLARSRLRALLADHADVIVEAEAEDSAAALQAIRTLKPDLVLLDIEMPGGGGVELARRLHVTPAPFVVFVTAHAEHAVEAFAAGAVDYLLKPFDEPRLATSLARAREALAGRRALAGTTGHLERVAVSLGKRTLFVATAAIDWLAASGNYVELHVGGEVHLMRGTLGALELQLDPRVFVRVHRSYVVRLDAVKELRSLGAGEQRIVLADGMELPVSPRYRDRLPRA
jgi:two-component system, LytTR family, response regulator